MVKCLFDQLKLHGVVLAWGLTAVLGVLIHLPALELVVWRTGLAAAALGVITPFLGGRLRLPLRPTLHLLATGVLIGAHWMLFFGAGKVSNATITVAGLPTTLPSSVGRKNPKTGARPLRPGASNRAPM